MTNTAKMPRKANIQRALMFIAIATAVLFGFSIGVAVLSYIANSHRINDIQQSRLNSCERTYQAFTQVFKPFFPPVKTRTDDVKKNIAKFERIVRRLKSDCTYQVSTGKK